MIRPSVKLAHVQLVSIRAINYDFLVEYILKFNFVEASQTAFEGFIMG